MVPTLGRSTLKRFLTDRFWVNNEQWRVFLTLDKQSNFGNQVTVRENGFA